MHKDTRTGDCSFIIREDETSCLCFMIRFLFASDNFTNINDYLEKMRFHAVFSLGNKRKYMVVWMGLNFLKE